PERRTHGLGAGRVDLHLAASGILVAIKNFLERLAAIRGAKNSPLLVRPVWMPGDGDEQPLGIARVDRELRDLLPITQSQMRPRFSRVSRFVDAVANGQIRTVQTFAAPNVNHVRIRQ